MLVGPTFKEASIRSHWLLVLYSKESLRYNSNDQFFEESVSSELPKLQNSSRLLLKMPMNFFTLKTILEDEVLKLDLKKTGGQRTFGCSCCCCSRSNVWKSNGDFDDRQHRFYSATDDTVVNVSVNDIVVVDVDVCKKRFFVQLIVDDPAPPSAPPWPQRDTFFNLYQKS